MEHVFKSLTNHKNVDLVPYVKSYLENKNDVKIYVGCDSQNVGNNTLYACVIVLYSIKKGGHVLYMKKKVDRIRDRFTRLWNEVELSMEIAMYLDSFGIHASGVDIDINPDPKYGSNNVLRSAMGLIESYGFVGRCKPFALAASYCADMLCK